MFYYSTVVLDDTPQAYYRCDESSGSVAHDLTNNHYDAQLSGGFTLDQPGAIASDPDTALSLNAITGLLVLPVSMNIPSWSAISLEFWIKTSSGWQYVVITCNASSQVLYLNGSPVASGAGSGDEIVLGQDMSFGGSNATVVVDEIAVYSYVLLPGQVQTHYRAGLLAVSGLPTDLSVYKYQLVQVYAPGVSGYGSIGAYIDTWRDAPVISNLKESINAGADLLRITLPRPYNNPDPNGRITMAAGNVVQVYIFGPGLPSTGKLRFQGVIDKYEPSLSASGAQQITVTVTPYSAIIADNGQASTNTYVGVDPLVIVQGPAVGSGTILTLDPGNPSSSGLPSVNYTASYSNWKQQMDDAMLMLQSGSVGWFYRVNTDKTLTINQTPVTAQHVLVVGQHLMSYLYSSDWTLLKNAISFLGGGSPPVSAFVNGSDITTYGERIYFKQDSRVTRSADATTLANGILAFYDRAILRSTIEIPDYRGSPGGLGYDIESIKSGDSIQVIDPSVEPEYVSPVAQIVTVTYNFDMVKIELGQIQPNESSAVWALQAQFQDFTMVS